MNMRVYGYPGTGLSWYRDVDDGALVDAGAQVRSTFELLANVLRVFEVELELHREDGLQIVGLRGPLPAGVDRRIDAGPTEFVDDETLSPLRLSSWVDANIQLVPTALEGLVVRTGAVAARAPQSKDADPGVDVLVGGETYFVELHRWRGGAWLTGPIDWIGASAPIEVTLTCWGIRWNLSISLLWSAWELENGDLEPRMAALSSAFELARWTRRAS